ncbi:Gldg family protein [Kaistella anthropi]|nr:Gldg family protein [Kaistella anthropi]
MIIPANEKELTLADVPKLKNMDALVIAKPRKPFTENEKVILDQYIMNGGKTLWMIDAVNAEMDTLFQSKKSWHTRWIPILRISFSITESASIQDW